jgi:ribosomal protein S18 acetylase RimI-like enzyme
VKSAGSAERRLDCTSALSETNCLTLPVVEGDEMEVLSERSFIPCRELAASGKLAAAELIIESLPDLYLSTRIRHPDLQHLIADQFQDDGTELFTAYAMSCGEGVDGVFAAYPARHGRELQEGSTFRLISETGPENRPHFEDWLFRHRARIAPIPADSFYLARFAIAPRRRGTGDADHLLRKYLSLAAGLAICSLHVSNLNHRAIAFYKKRGFAVFASCLDGYSSMWLCVDRNDGMEPRSAERASGLA